MESLYCFEKQFATTFVCEFFFTVSLDADGAYQDFSNVITKAAKKIIPHGYQNNYAPCWDAECEYLYKTYLQSPQGDDSGLAATAASLASLASRVQRIYCCSSPQKNKVKLPAMIPYAQSLKFILELF